VGSNIELGEGDVSSQRHIYTYIDTYFQNTKKGELHKLTTLNKVMVIQQDGSVFISTR